MTAHGTHYLLDATLVKYKFFMYFPPISYVEVLMPSAPEGARH